MKRTEWTKKTAALLMAASLAMALALMSCSDDDDSGSASQSQGQEGGESQGGETSEADPLANVKVDDSLEITYDSAQGTLNLEAKAGYNDTWWKDGKILSQTVAGATLPFTASNPKVDDLASKAGGSAAGTWRAVRVGAMDAASIDVSDPEPQDGWRLSPYTVEIDADGNVKIKDKDGNEVEQRPKEEPIDWDEIPESEDVVLIDYNNTQTYAWYPSKSFDSIDPNDYTIQWYKNNERAYYSKSAYDEQNRGKLMQGELNRQCIEGISVGDKVYAVRMEKNDIDNKEKWARSKPMTCSEIKKVNGYDTAFFTGQGEEGSDYNKDYFGKGQYRYYN